MTEHSDAYTKDATIRELKAKYAKLLKISVYGGAAAMVTILALNSKVKSQVKTIAILKDNVKQLDKNLEGAWQAATDNYFAACVIADVVKPSAEQFKEIEAGLIKIKGKGPIL